MIRLQNLLGVGEPCNPIKEAAVSVLFPSWTKFHKDRKDVYQQLLACSPGRCLRFLDFQQMFGRHDSVCISSSRNAVWSETTVILGPVMLRAHSFKIIGTRNRWVWSWVPHQYLLHFRLRWISQPLWASFSQCVIRQKKKNHIYFIQVGCEDQRRCYICMVPRPSKCSMNGHYFY